MVKKALRVHKDYFTKTSQMHVFVHNSIADVLDVDEHLQTMTIRAYLVQLWTEPRLKLSEEFKDQGGGQWESNPWSSLIIASFLGRIQGTNCCKRLEILNIHHLWYGLSSIT